MPNPEPQEPTEPAPTARTRGRDPILDAVAAAVFPPRTPPVDPEVAQLRDTVTTLQTTVDRLTGTTLRQALIPIDTIGRGQTPIQVTWSAPMPDANYSVTATVESAAGADTVTAALQAGSKTTEGCVILLTTTAANVHVAGQLHVLAYSLARGVRK